jgi:hypothetical protein
VTRPSPTMVYHFTRVEHLSTILRTGLHCDRHAKEHDLLRIEVGNRDIKARRSTRTVPVGPGGVVSDYVPFYFAPRSPMMYSIHMGNVPGYDQGTRSLVYLVASVDDLMDAGLKVVLTDRNAVLRVADFHDLASGEPSEDFVDWPLMSERYWNCTDEYPDRLERRMAECLVHGTVPWRLFTEVAAKSDPVAGTVRSLIGGHASPSVSVRPEWYF